MTEEAFLRGCYLINGNSFNGLAAYETMPMRKWIQLVEIHNEAVEERQKEFDNI